MTGRRQIWTQDLPFPKPSRRRGPWPRRRQCRRLWLRRPRRGATLCGRKSGEITCFGSGAVPVLGALVSLWPGCKSCEAAVAADSLQQICARPIGAPMLDHVSKALISVSGHGQADNTSGLKHFRPVVVLTGIFAPRRQASTKSLARFCRVQELPQRTLTNSSSDHDQIPRYCRDRMTSASCCIRKCMP